MSGQQLGQALDAPQQVPGMGMGAMQFGKQCPLGEGVDAVPNLARRVGITRQPAR